MNRSEPAMALVPIRPVDNERCACDAVARVLEERAERRRSGEWSPEDDKVGPPVEYVFEVAGVTYAIEHTVIEAFDKQIQKDIDFGAFIEPIAALDGYLPPPGTYRLTFEIHPSAGLKRSLIAKSQITIVDWVQTAAAKMHAECPDVPTRDCRPRGHESLQTTAINGIEVHLRREVHWSLPSQAYGRLFCSRFAPENYEALRVVRMCAALAKKLPKLRRWKQTGARSVLVLENRDISLSNHVVTFEAAEEALRSRDDAPDELWLVDTTLETQWTVWCLLRDGVAFPDEETPMRYSVFDPKNLIAVCSS